MKILIIHEVDYFNKVVFEFQMLSEALSSLGHEVIVIDYPEAEVPQYFEKQHDAFGIKIFNNVYRIYNKASLKLIRPFYIRMPFIKRASYVFSVGYLIKKIMKSQRIDFILLFSVPHSGWQTVKLAHKYNIPVIFRSLDVLHKLVPRKIYEIPTLILEKYVYRNADLILALTPKLMDYTIRLGAQPLKVKLQLTGADTNLFRPLSKNLDLAKKWGINQNDKIVLFAGTLYKFSALDWLAEHWHLVLKEIPQAKLLILGEGSLFGKLKKIREKRGSEKKIILTGWQSHRLVPDFIALSDVCLNLFQLNDIICDIIPSKLFQYLACAKPVIVSPLPGTIDILNDEKDGVIYAKDNFDALTLIIRLLKNEEEAKRIGENGYKLIKREYAWDKIVSDILEKIKKQFKIV